MLRESGSCKKNDMPQSCGPCQRDPSFESCGDWESMKINGPIRRRFPFRPNRPWGGPPMKRPPMPPVVDQRVRVRFERKEYYSGTITAVATSGQSFKIFIKYDDGSMEKDSPYPDPDITLVTPGEYR